MKGAKTAENTNIPMTIKPRTAALFLQKRFQISFAWLCFFGLFIVASI
jgi:hypothetical protein